MRKFIAAFVGIAILASAFYFLRLAPSHVEVEKTLRMGVFKQGVQAPLYLALRKSAELEGHELKIQFVEFGSATALNQAFLAGEVDIMFNGSIQIADLHEQGVKAVALGGHAFIIDELVFRNDFPNPSWKSLKGSHVGTPGDGNTSHSALKVLLRRLGNVEPLEISFVKGSQAGLLALLEKSEIDSALLKLESLVATFERGLHQSLALNDAWVEAGINDLGFVMIWTIARPEVVKENEAFFRQLEADIDECIRLVAEGKIDILNLCKSELSMPETACIAIKERWSELYIANASIPDVRTRLQKHLDSQFKEFLDSGEIRSQPKDYWYEWTQKEYQ
jgi:ABC-type nitrate/sulfonate/bicarbonate transport system substrate-binding protein